MKDDRKTKAELIKELKESRQKISLLQKSNPAETDKEWLSDNIEELNRAVIENSPLGISVRTFRGKLLSVNASWKKIWNLSDDQVNELMKADPEKPNFDYTKQSLGKWLPKVENIYKNGGLLHIPKILLTDEETDRTCWVSLTYYAINDDNGDVGRIVILTDDITQRVNLERGILESQSKYRSVIDNANIGVLVIQDNRMVFCNATMHDMLGYTEEEYYKIDFLSTVHPDDRSIAVERIEARLSGASKDLKPLKIRAICKSGEIKWVEANSTMIQWGNRPALQAFVCDITERNQAEEALWESKEKYKLLLENLNSIIVNFSLDGTIIYCSPNVKELGGYDSKAEIGQHFTKYIAEKADIVKSQEIFHRILTFKKSETFEFLYQPKNKKPFYVEAKANPVFKNGSENLESISCIVSDITERKRAEEALQRYECIVSSSNDMLALLDKNFVYLAANKRYVQAFGLTHSELVGSTVSTICGNEFFESIIRPNAEKSLQGHEVRYQDWFEFPTYGKRYMEIIYDPYRGPDNEIKGFVINGRDITKRKQAEEERRMLAEAVKYSSELVNLATLEGKMIFLNEAGGKILGIDPDNVHSVNIMEVIPEHWTEFVEKELLPALMKGGHWKGDLQYRNIKTGQLTDVHAMTFTVKDPETGEPQFLANVSLDITERKKAEKALRQSEEKYRMFMETATDLITIVDSEGKFSFVNDAAIKILGYTKKELIGMPVIKILKDTKKSKTALKELIEHGRVSFEEVWVAKDGTEIYGDQKLVAFYNNKGEYEGARGIFRDITERTIAEKKLKESEKRYHELFNSLIEGVGVVDEDETIQLCNPAYAKIFEEDSADKIIGNSLFKYIPEDQKQIIQSESEKRRRGIHSQYELEIITAKSNRRTILVTVNPQYDDNTNFVGALGALIDITETKRLREQESRAQRLETAGRVAGQIAHDFNNLLAPLVAYPDFIKEAIPENHPTLKYINDMEKSANQIAEINQQLLTLSRRGHYNQETLNLNEVIQLAIEEMGILPQTLIIETDFAKNLMNVGGGAAQIQRIFSNLIHNARDAMQDIGNIIIKTENYYADNLKINYGHVPKGEYVKITITDNGCGITDDIRPNIFDPFFTTKSSDKKRGSGLGLSVVDAIMNDHDGFIDLQSTIGEGTSFYLYFPITRESIDIYGEKEIVGGTETVLVVDDDKAQCIVALRLLKKLGYNATAVNSGEEAIEYLKENPRDLLILDMIMPDGIDGTETYQQVLEMYPDQKAIIVSGYAESSRIDEARQLGIDIYIRKPLTLKLIASSIRKTLYKKEVSANTV